MQFGLIQVLSAFGLPFRNSKDIWEISMIRTVVYLSLLKFIATRDPVLREHVNGDKKIKYVSKMITDEQIVVLINETRNSIISDVEQE